MSVTVWPGLVNSSISASSTEQINSVVRSFNGSPAPISFYSLDSNWTDEGECCEPNEYGGVDELVVEMPVHEYVVMEVAKSGFVRTANTIFASDAYEVTAFALKTHEVYDCAVSDTQPVIAQDIRPGGVEVVAVDGVPIEELSACEGGLVRDVEPGEHIVRLEDTVSDRGGLDVRVWVPEDGAAYIPGVFNVPQQGVQRSTSGGEP